MSIRYWILLSRCYCSGQFYGTARKGFKKINPNVVVCSVNLQSQDNSTQFAPDQPVVELAGWSESIFRFMAAMEVGDSLIEHVKTDY